MNQTPSIRIQFIVPVLLKLLIHWEYYASCCTDNGNPILAELLVAPKHKLIQPFRFAKTHRHKNGLAESIDTAFDDLLFISDDSLAKCLALSHPWFGQCVDPGWSVCNDSQKYTPHSPHLVLNMQMLWPKEWRALLCMYDELTSYECLSGKIDLLSG